MSYENQINIQNEIFSDVELWESRTLGANESSVKAKGMSNKLKKLINNQNDQKMQMISIRLPVNLINDLKEISEVEGLGYQALAREVLQRFADAESRKKVNELIAQKRELQRQLDEMQTELKMLKKA
jgi:predicted DNA binding CopG/RHH family protein